MTIRAELIFALGALVLLVASATPDRAAAQASFEIPRAAGGKPDFNGIYEWPRGLPGADTCRCSATIFDRKNFAPLLGNSAEPFLEPRTGDPRHDEPRAFCMPSGFPSAFLGPYPVQFIQTPQHLVMSTEFMNVTRIIPLDGRSHKTDIEPTFYGEPVGHWEGDTLVIDGRNYKRWSLDDWYYTNPKEYRMHSEAFHTIERLRRVDANTIAYQFTVDDPKIFTKPWSVDWEMKRHPEWDRTGLYEMVCNENNRCEGGKCRDSK